MKKTFSSIFASEEVPMKDIEIAYKPIIGLLNILLGFTPNSLKTLTIWNPGLVSCLLLVPNFLGLPQSLFGKKKRKAIMGLSMYAASKAASCSYCTAHTCNFALRRGAQENAIKGIRTRKEELAMEVADAMARIPSSMNYNMKQQLCSEMSTKEVRNVVLPASLMGFLNKVMDSLGIPLEEQVVLESGTLLGETGWSIGKHGEAELEKKAANEKVDVDHLGTYLKLFKFAPGAVKIEKEWTKGIPETARDAMSLLKQQTGCDFSILEHLSSKNQVRALTKVLLMNLDPSLSQLGIKSKVLVGGLFAKLVFNPALTGQLLQVSSRLSPEITDELIEGVLNVCYEKPINDEQTSKDWIESVVVNTGLSEKEAVAAFVACNISGSPVNTEAYVIEESVKCLNSIEIVEIVTWVSVLQLIHRLTQFYQISPN